MFDEKEIEAYRKISAPDGLRERVLSSCAEYPKARRNLPAMLRTISSAAACLALVVVLSVFTMGRFGDASVSVSGDAILPESSVSVYPEHGVAPLSAQPTGKSIPAVSFPIALSLSEKTKITVSAGEMQMTDDTDESVSFGSALTADGEILIHWYVNPNDTENAFVMTLRGALKSETLTLAYNEINDTWTISRGEN
ncbi:MAG: hypothetical protein IJ489_06820 [Clostridia bacterium]|nr:hypothetical protein [Clostridia bacterium]